MAKVYTPKEQDLVYWDGKCVGHIEHVTVDPHGVTAQVRLDLPNMPHLSAHSRLSIFSGG